MVHGASVLITNRRTLIQRTVMSDGDGNYTAANLDPAIYSLSVDAAGFRKQTTGDIELLARQIARFDFRLEVGSVTSEQVSVTAATVISTESPTVADSKSGREINELALNFRATNNTSPIVVATLAPEVQQDRGGNISIAGGEPYTTSASIDGISTLNPRFNGPVRDLFPSVEGILEFKVSSSGNNAEFSQITDITTTSKSGGNDYHGTAFWFHQNRALNATDPFAPIDPGNPGRRVKAALVANSFGGAFRRQTSGASPVLSPLITRVPGRSRCR